MAKWLLVFFLLYPPLLALAQQSVFRLDSLPPDTGVLLDEGWKFHAGDNPAWARPGFDDSQWATINPVKDIMSLKQLDDTPIFWLRLHLKVDSTLRGKTFALSVKQTGASQFFLNGKLINEVGRVSPVPAEVRGYDPMGEPIALPFSTAPDQFLCVRFAKADLFLINHFYARNELLQLKIAPVESILSVYDKSHHTDTVGLYLGYFKAGLFLLFAFLHLWLYNYYKDQKSNLYFSIWSFLTMLYYVVSSITFHVNDLAIRNTITLIFAPLAPIFVLFYYQAIVYQFKVRQGIWHKIIVVVAIVCSPLVIRPYSWGWVPGVIGLAILIALEICRITWGAYKKGDKAALIIMWGEIISLLFLIVSPFVMNHYVSFSYKSIVSNIVYNISILARPFAILYYLASQFESNRKSLQQKLAEVQQLSQEKVETLLGQNAELKAALLQGQTTERQRVAADLHDNLGTTLSALQWTLEAINPKKLSVPEQALWNTLCQQVSDAYTDVRLLSHNLLPQELAKLGLPATLQLLVDKLNRNKAVHFSLELPSPPPRFDAQTEFEVYSICLELANNTLKHAHATKASIVLSQQNGQLHLTINDDGVGINGQRSKGRGLQNVAARVASLGGTWAVESEPGGGVQSRIVVPGSPSVLLQP